MSAIRSARIIFWCKIGVRIVFLILSFLVCYMHSHIECHTAKALANIIIGMAISIMALAITEIIVFIVEVYETYKIERDRFLNLALKYNKKIIKRLLKLRAGEKTPVFVNKLTGKTGELEEVKAVWEKIRDDVDSLMNEMYEFQYKSEYYVLSGEFIKYYNYLNRFYYILLANLRGEADVENIFKNIFYYDGNTECINGIEQMNIIQKRCANIDAAYNDMRKNLTLSESKYDTPDCILETRHRSCISMYDCVNLPQNKKIKYTLIFRPCEYFENILCTNTKDVKKLKLIKELLFGNNDI